MLRDVVYGALKLYIALAAGAVTFAAIGLIEDKFRRARRAKARPANRSLAATEAGSSRVVVPFRVPPHPLGEGAATRVSRPLHLVHGGS